MSTPPPSQSAFSFNVDGPTLFFAFALVAITFTVLMSAYIITQGRLSYGRNWAVSLSDDVLPTIRERLPALDPKGDHESTLTEFSESIDRCKLSVILAEIAVRQDFPWRTAGTRAAVAKADKDIADMSRRSLNPPTSRTPPTRTKITLFSSGGMDFQQDMSEQRSCVEREIGPAKL